MSEQSCELVRDRLPEYVRHTLQRSERLDVDAHLADCNGCRRDAEVIDLLRRTNVSVPAGLQHRVQAAAQRAPQRMSWRARGALLVAASVTLVLGAQVLSSMTEIAPPVQSASLPTEGRSLMQPFPGSGEVVAAGSSATLNDLSDEQLRSLLAELES